MSNPPNTEGLAAEVIDLLRKEVETAGPLDRRSQFSSDQWLATLDKAIDTERERVLAEVDEAARHLGDFEVWFGTDGSVGIDAVWDRDAEGWRRKLNANSFTQAILAAPQESNQEGAG